MMLRITAKYLLMLLCLSTAPVVLAEEGGSEFPVYIELNPDFIVNYSASGTRLKYIKAKITLRASSPVNADVIKQHMPIVRDTLVMYLSELTGDQVKGAVARETARASAIGVLNESLKKETGQEPVMDVLFSSFVTQ